MKKTITILLVLLVAAFAVFALDQTLTLQSKIDNQVDFTYGLGYKLSTASGGFAYLGETSTTNTLGTLDSGSILTPGAAQTVNFVVRQDKRVNVNAATSYTFSVSATQWKLSGVEVASLTDEQTNAVTLGNFNYSPVTYTDNLHNVSAAEDETSGEGTVKVSYAKGITDKNTELVTFDATWGDDSDLEAGEYTSTVTLAYTAI